MATGLGNPKAIDLAARQPAPKVTASDVENMVARLANRLRENPDDPKGWSCWLVCKALGRYAEAAEAYGKGFSWSKRMPNCLQTMPSCWRSPTTVSRRLAELLDKGAEACARGPASAAAGRCCGRRARETSVQQSHTGEKVLPLMEPGSEEAEVLGAALERAREAAGRPKPGKPQGK